MSDDDIPVLRDAVARKPRGRLNQEQIDEICAGISADAQALIDNLVAEALREAETELRARLNERLQDEIPALVEKALRDTLQSD